MTPLSYEKQLEIFDIKISSIQKNKSIPQDKKQALLESLYEQKKQLIANPEKYTSRRLNDQAMKLLMTQVEAHINFVNNNKAFNKLVNAEIYKVYNIDMNNDLSEAGIKFDSKYVSKLFIAAKDTYFASSFKEEFLKLINLIKNSHGRKLTEFMMDIPENQETRKLFEANGLDFDRWIKFIEESKYKFIVKVDTQKAVEATRENLVKELNSEVAKKLDPTVRTDLLNILSDMNINEATQKDLPKIIKAIETYIASSEYFKQDKPEIQEFKDHVKIHKINIHDVEKMKDSTEQLFVRLWDKNDIGRNLFFGNHVGCCTSIGGGNSFAAPQHLKNAFVNGLEIVDNAGNSVGNSMCYFAKIDGKLTFIIDSCEAVGKLGAAHEVTDAIIEYAKQVCKEMGRPDANIMFGPNYNKLNLTRCVKTEGHTVEVVGKAPENTYIDSVGGRASINSAAENRPMHEIIDL